jgi:hypothetical protein
MKDTVTLMLNGRIPRQFSQAMRAYADLLDAPLAAALKVRDDVELSVDGVIGAEESAEEAGAAYPRGG